MKDKYTLPDTMIGPVADRCAAVVKDFKAIEDEVSKIMGEASAIEILERNEVNGAILMQKLVLELNKAMPFLELCNEIYIPLQKFNHMMKMSAEWVENKKK